MKCQRCGETFTQMQDGYDEVPYGSRHERVCTHARCPYCGAEETEEDYICVQCGEEVCGSDISDGFCRFCAEELEQTLDWIRSMLTPAQQKWMRMHPEWTEVR